MSLTEILLSGILIMQVIKFHYNTSSSGRYMKYYDAMAHRLIKYLGRGSGHQLAKAYRCLRIYLGKLARKIRFWS